MNNLAFLKKEFKEIIKTYRIWVIPLIFLFFGMLSPIVVKILPDLFKSQLKSQGIVINIPPQTAVDSFIQYFKNLSQVGTLAIILFTMGLMSEEKSRGTLTLIVTKPISRAWIVMSKFIAQTVIILVSMIIGGIICYIYTIFLFKKVSFNNFALGTLDYAAYMILIISITLFFSTIFANQIAGGGLSLVALIILSLLPGITKSLAKYSPGSLTNQANDIVSGKATISVSFWPMVISLILVFVLLSVSVMIFQRQEL